VITLRRKMFFGAAWMMSVRLVDRGIGLASTIILARLLLPADFGIVAMAMGVVAFLELFAAFGFDSALIQRADIERSHYDTAWTFNVVFGAVVGLGLLALAWPAAAFYQQPALAWVLYSLAFAPLIQSLENIGLVAFRRDLNFRAEFLITACKRLLLFVITVWLALVWRSYWALVVGIIVGRSLGVGLSYLVHPFRPRFSLAKRHELLGFSKWVLGTNFISFALQRCPDVIIGRALGATSLGLYTVGGEIASLPASELVAPINRAVFPGFARLAGEPGNRGALRSEYFTFIGFVAMLAIPAAVGVASIAHQIVPLVLGDKWLDAIPIVQIIALAGTLQVMQSTNYAVYLSVGRPSRQALIHATQVVVLIPSMVWLSPSYGIIGAAVAFAVSCMVTYPVNVSMLLPALEARLRDYVRPLWRPVLAAAAMYFVLRAVSEPSVGLSASLQMFALARSIVLGATVYVVVVLLSWLAVGRPTATETLVLERVVGFLREQLRSIGSSSAR
jgi:lipopolysaccharide exporter